MDNKNHIQIYTTSSCSYCDKAKEYFKSKSLQYEEYNVALDVEKRTEMVEKTGQFGVPVIVVNDKMIIGFNRDAIDKALV